MHFSQSEVWSHIALSTKPKRAVALDRPIAISLYHAANERLPIKKQEVANHMTQVRKTEFALSPFR